MSTSRGPRPIVQRAPAPGLLLIAMPMLTEPTFARSVIFLLEADASAGVVGVILTSPTHTPVGSVLPRWHDAMTEPSVVFRGGPVQADGALCLARVPVALAETRPLTDIRTVRQPFTAAPFADRVGIVDLDGDIDEVRSAAVDLRVYAGHASWAPGQLENEIDEGAWLVVPARLEDVFTSAPETRWCDVLRRQRFPDSLLASYPQDPTLN